MFNVYFRSDAYDSSFYCSCDSEEQAEFVCERMQKRTGDEYYYIFEPVNK